MLEITQPSATALVDKRAEGNLTRRDRASGGKGRSRAELRGWGWEKMGRRVGEELTKIRMFELNIDASHQVRDERTALRQNAEENTTVTEQPYSSVPQEHPSHTLTHSHTLSLSRNRLSHFGQPAASYFSFVILKRRYFIGPAAWNSE